MQKFRIFDPPNNSGKNSEFLIPQEHKKVFRISDLPQEHKKKFRISDPPKNTGKYSEFLIP